MPLTGHTRAYPLQDIFQFIDANKYTGTLQLEQEKDKRTCYFVQGNLTIPLAAIQLRRPQVLVEMELVSSSALQEAQSLQKQSGGQLGSILLKMNAFDLEKTGAVLKRVLEEDIYAMYMEEYSYEFHKNVLSPLLRNQDPQQVFTFPTGSINMEASRRMDTFKNIEKSIPDLVYHYTGNLEGLDEKEAEIARLFQGGTKISQFIRHYKLDRYRVYTLLDKWKKENLLTELPPQEFPRLAKNFQKEQRFAELFYIFANALENPLLSDHLSQLAEQTFGQSSIKSHMNKGKEGFVLHLKGWEFCQMIGYALSQRLPLQMIVKVGKKDLFFQLEDKYLKYGERGRRPWDIIIQALMRRSGMEDKSSGDHVNKQVDGNKVYDELLRSKLLPKKEIQPFLENLCLNQFHLLYHEEEVTVHIVPELDTVSQYDPYEYKYGFTSSLSGFTKQLIETLNLRLELPDAREVLLMTQKAASRPSPNLKIRELAAVFNQNRRPFYELMDYLASKFELLEILNLVLDHLNSEKLRKLSIEEIRSELEVCFREWRKKQAEVLLESAKAQGYLEQDEYFARLNEEFEFMFNYENPDIPKLEGELATFSLAEILQTLVGSQLTGTLTIIDDETGRNKDLYFQHGEVYVLRKEAHTKREAQSMFLDTSAFKAVEESFEDMEQEQSLTEDEISDELAMEVKEDTYEIFLWEGARFVFILNGLPRDFMSPRSTFTKLMLKTDEFLMEAISRIDMWQEIIQVIFSEKTIFKFQTPETKQNALMSGLDPQVLLLIDGSHNIDDIVRISRKRKFNVCTILAELSNYNYITPMDLDSAAEEGAKAVSRGDYKRALNYYSYLEKFKPNDPQVQTELAKVKDLAQRPV